MENGERRTDKHAEKVERRWGGKISMEVSQFAVCLFSWVVEEKRNYST